MRRLAEGLRGQGRVAFVPTMGYLHAGHRSLLEWGRANADRLVASIFVNPAQFGPAEDLARYPRDFDRDRVMCEAAGVDALFVPASADIYRPGHQTWVEVENLSRGLCGRFRPGHFRGVATVVLKLLNIVRPHLAVFGLKDYQQYLIIRRLVADLDLDVEVVGRPIVREDDGLAMSSRNSYLGPEERLQARVLSRALAEAQRQVDAGERDARGLSGKLTELIAAEAPMVRVDYLALCDPATLDEVAGLGAETLLAVAAWVGKTRLIDNALLRVAPAGAA
jgi:pantoate--beta-alanine ligase